MEEGLMNDERLRVVRRVDLGQKRNTYVGIQILLAEKESNTR